MWLRFSEIAAMVLYCGVGEELVVEDLCECWVFIK
jgi:hypothetical protein